MPVRTPHPPVTRATPPRSGRDDGQTTVLVTLVVALALLVVMAVGRLGAAAVDRARARTAADAAALAGVVEEPRGDGRRRATEIAASNGAELTAYRAEGDEVEVTVQVDGAVATSRAERVIRTDR